MDRGFHGYDDGGQRGRRPTYGITTLLEGLLVSRLLRNASLLPEARTKMFCLGPRISFGQSSGPQRLREPQPRLFNSKSRVKQNRLQCGVSISYMDQRKRGHWTEHSISMAFN